MPTRKIPLFSEVAKEWIEYKKPKIRISTWEEYERQVKNHFGDLNKLKVNRISIASVEKFITKRQNEKMNLNTLRRILVTLNQIMNYAVRHRYIDQNPVREAERPRNNGHDIENQGKIKIFLDE